MQKSIQLNTRQLVYTHIYSRVEGETWYDNKISHVIIHNPAIVTLCLMTSGNLRAGAQATSRGIEHGMQETGLLLPGSDWNLPIENGPLYLKSY